MGHRANDHRGLSRRSLLELGAAATMVAALPGCGRGDDTPFGPARSTGPPDVLARAIDAYVFGYPMIMLDMMRAASAPTNTLDHSVLPDPLDRGVARLSHDMVYSQAWLNLDDEPLVLQLPEAERGRYWLFQVLDGWGNTVHDLTSKEPRTTAGAEGPPYTYLITGPRWSGQAPERSTLLHMPSTMATIVGRVQINGVEDSPQVDRFQDQVKLIPLSAWLRGELDRTVSRVRPIDRGPEPPVKRIAALDGRTYFNRLCRLMLASAPTPADAVLAEQLATIGVQPGGNVDGHPTEILDEAVRQAHRRIVDWEDPTAREVNGWEIPTEIGNFGTDYLRRAATTMRSPGLSPLRNVLYAVLWSAPAADEQGRPLRYRIRFDPGRWPPADAFSSITAYDPEGFLIPNAAEIYSVGHHPPVTPTADGTVDIALQYEDPRPAVPPGNWLPIPATGDFSLTLRLYAPKEDALEGKWVPPPMVPVQ
ncbi:DUF1254 domain-containing protein [Nocardia mangyaensis]|uniref:DUF1254 domain-containing protein n=1 Tax=Nocardia mangyaensis TaxID=2213200 RepID=UPI002674F307|nr:DUF1254 domain-containing protein [Nocardia mangyaensis]MDO3649799.1 DUF1254 domain-containing protein [Nocardia mangyaensis]